MFFTIPGAPDTSGLFCREAVIRCISEKFYRKPLSGPVHVDFTFYFSLPNNASKQQATDMLEDKIYHTSWPDCGFLADILGGIIRGMLFGDGGYVSSSMGKKLYSTTPRTEIKVQELTEEDIRRAWNPRPVDFAC